MRFYKHKVYKKYHDEIWGALITSKRFSYNKRSVLLNYKDLSLRARLRIKTKYNYFRRGFLKRLNSTLLKFKSFRKKIRLLNFLSKRAFLNSTSSISVVVRSYRKYRRGRRPKRKFFFKRKPISKFLLFNPIPFVKFNNSFKSTNVYLCKNRFTINSFFSISSSNKKQVWFNYFNFLRVNNVRFLIKKKLNLRRQKSFFYSVHIASPRKKLKKWSLYGLKNIYHKKISIFYGFKKTNDFLKMYYSALKTWGKNEQVLYLALEARLENVLLRLNYFPSIYFIKRFILSGNVYVNNHQITYPTYYLNPGEIISVNKNYCKFIYFHLKSSLKSKRIILNFPAFLEADYLLLASMVIRKPQVTDLTLPVSFNLYTPFISVSR